MAIVDKTYHTLLEKILQEGYFYDDPKRSGVKRLEIPSYIFRHEFKDGFPAITTKKLGFKNVITELIWFLRGDTNIKYLVDNGCNIWNKDAYNYYLKNINDKQYPEPMSMESFIQHIKDGCFDSNASKIKLGDLGPVYGSQWRNYLGINLIASDDNDWLGDWDGNPIKVDQIINLINNLKEQPLATDHLVTAWNPAELEDMALPPCHYGFQIVVRPLNDIERYKIWYTNNYETGIEYNEHSVINFDDPYYIPTSKYGFELHWNQRSVDTFLGLPYNIASYASLALIIEKLTGYKALAIQGDLKKVHLYDNSIEGVKEQLSRDINKYDKSRFVIENGILFEAYRNGKIENLDELINAFEIRHFNLKDYKSYPAIKVDMLERDE